VDQPNGASSDEGRLVGRILMDELTHWDGTARDAERRASLRLLIAANTFDRRELYFACLVPSELAGTTLVFSDETLELGDEGDLAELPIPITNIALQEGVRTVVSDVTIVYQPRLVIPMARRGVDVWRSVDYLDPGEEAYALVADKELDGFYSMVPEASRSVAVTNVPTSWTLFRDLEFQADLTPRSLNLAGLVPRPSALPSLVGGFRLGGGRKYLDTGPPDILVPEAEGLTTEVLVDGRAIATIGSEGGRVRLAALDLESGEHSLVAGSRRFRIVLEPFDWWAPPTQPLLAHAFTRIGKALMPMGCVGADSLASADIVTAGGVVTAIPDPSPVFLVPLAGEITVFGRPGEVHHVKSVATPWMGAIGLKIASFEPLARHAYSGGRPFLPYWVAWYEEPGPWQVSACMNEPDNRARVSGPALKRWAEVLCTLADAVVRGDEEVKRWWSSYVQMADSSCDVS